MYKTTDYTRLYACNITIHMQAPVEEYEGLEEEAKTTDYTRLYTCTIIIHVQAVVEEYEGLEEEAEASLHVQDHGPHQTICL